ncbi:PQQ-dependent sugar dehydrogenase [Actinotalea ferrariae]|uniref:PQQ-dependent sugar dehydrogenase n=1 Tax=Actinotalea ferrariae TaxID=1386098 RepID=UPI0021AB9457|nr:PQQ-dependent sugar dehydrogenase [Actinotalea ferrariae]
MGLPSAPGVGLRLSTGGRRRRAAGRRLRGLAVVGLLALTAAGCTAPAPEPTLHLRTDGPGTAAPTATAAAPAPAFPPGPALADATGTPTDVLTGLTTPWSIAFLPGGSFLVTLRDPAQVLLVTGEGAAALTGPGAEDLAATTLAQGEGGLLGVAVSPDVATDRLVLLYRTTASGNEVVRARLEDDLTLGALEPVLTGIPAESNHNGGRIAFGPDGNLYVGTGDAGEPDAAQDPTSLAGKILRVTADGDPAPGNPDPGSPVWSLGHRNVQGLAWHPDGRLLASEFGQNTFDELNVVEPGGNYGWPVVEGRADDPDGDFVDPVTTWSTDVASPSGIATTDDGVHLAALRGERLWSIGFLGDGFADAGDSLEGVLGRLRDVVRGPDGALWLLTQNTDGRGEPRAGDDRVVRVLP